MKAKIILIPAFILLTFLYSSGQSISGAIIDKKTKEPLPFVTISIKGSTTGTITNYKGEYELKVAANQVNADLVIACVGYETITIPVKKSLETKILNVELLEKVTQLDEIVVTDKSMQAYTIVRKAVEAINKNYISKPFNCELYYSNDYDENNVSTKQQESIVLLYDNRGYIRSNPYQVFKDCNYKFIQSKRNYKVKTLRDGNSNIDEILEFDIVRNTGNVLDIKRLNDFNIRIESETIYEGDSIWILNYFCKNPDLVNTGDFYAIDYKGKIYIKKKDFAIVFNQTSVKSGNLCGLGRSIYQNPLKKEWKTIEAEYSFEVKYGKTSDFYCLKSIKHGKTMKLEELNTKNKKEVKTKSLLALISINSNQVTKISGRTYYENMAFNKSFWDSFTGNYSK